MEGLLAQVLSDPKMVEVITEMLCLATRHPKTVQETIEGILAANIPKENESTAIMIKLRIMEYMLAMFV